MVNEVGSVIHPPVAMPRSIFGPGFAPAGRGHQGGEITAVGVAIQSPLHAQIRQAKDALSDAALEIRAADATLDEADQLLAQIKDRLISIVKQYPPFALDNPQRVSYLNSISGLRQQLEALTFPPAREAVQVPAQAGRAMALSELSPPLPAIPKQGELTVPELPPDAPDEAVAGALDEVARARGQIAQLKQSMWEDVMRFVGSLDSQHAATQAERVHSFVAASPGHALAGGTPALVAEMR